MLAKLCSLETLITTGTPSDRILGTGLEAVVCDRTMSAVKKLPSTARLSGRQYRLKFWQGLGYIMAGSCSYPMSWLQKGLDSTEK